MRRLALVPAAAVLAACGTTTPQAHTPPTSDGHGTTTAAATRTAPARLRVKVMRWRLPAPIAREAICRWGINSTGAFVTVAGGLLDGDASTASAYVLSLKDGHTQRLPDLAVPVHDTAGGLGFVIGGGNASEQDVVQGYTPAGGWKVVGHLPQPRSDLSVVVVASGVDPGADQRVVALGGYNGVRPAEPGILEWNGSGWDQIGRLPLPVRYAATAAIGNDIYVVGGERAGVMQTAIQRVDATTGKARIIGHLPGPLGHASAVVLGARILVVGGRTGVDTLTDRMWWLDPASGHLTKAGHLPFPLADSAVTTDGGHAFLIGGEVPNDTDKVLRLSLR